MLGWNKSKIDIIIPFYNQHKLLSRCLKSVELHNSQDVRIVIVNDGSEPQDIRIIKNLCGNLDLEIILLSHKVNKGFRESILTGVAHCDGPYVILLNSDTVVTDNFTRKLTRIMMKDKSIGAVAPISNHPTDLYQFRKKLYLKRHFEDLDHHQVGDRFAPLLNRSWTSRIKNRLLSDTCTRVPYLSACCLALNREVFKKAGFFYQEYEHGYFEDLDLSCCIRNQGYDLAINEDCFVFHRGQGSYKDIARACKEKLIWKNYDIFVDRWGHLPEHDDLCKRMQWAGNECPI
ncbi:glycosyltransferase family 2 protein [candidate division CSSED10-310 bacterium]|uniref:Glycosyltransferase family 2 protein n=1 Tax=candidate division CSSED10-310 bacterium TaxID=2855610 RepID=A0ABV6YT60_UNCC1